MANSVIGAVHATPEAVPPQTIERGCRGLGLPDLSPTLNDGWAPSVRRARSVNTAQLAFLQLMGRSSVCALGALLLMSARRWRACKIFERGRGGLLGKIEVPAKPAQVIAFPQRLLSSKFTVNELISMAGGSGVDFDVASYGIEVERSFAYNVGVGFRAYRSSMEMGRCFFEGLSVMKISAVLGSEKNCVEDFGAADRRPPRIGAQFGMLALWRKRRKDDSAPEVCRRGEKDYSVSAEETPVKCSQVFHRLRVGVRTFGALSWPTLIQAEQCRVAQFAPNDFGPYGWRSGGLDGGVGCLAGSGLHLLRLICRVKRSMIGPHSRDW